MKNHFLLPFFVFLIVGCSLKKEPKILFDTSNYQKFKMGIQKAALLFQIVVMRI